LEECSLLLLLHPPAIEHTHELEEGSLLGSEILRSSVRARHRDDLHCSVAATA
jgi:hypothetical protein